MNRVYRTLVFAALAVSAPAHARSDYPTVEIVGYVLECMKDNGGQTLENMYSCVCRFDKLSSLINFEDYEVAMTQRRFLKMPGERGGVFRENDGVRDMVKDLEKTLADADKACPTVKRSGITTPAKP